MDLKKRRFWAITLSFYLKQRGGVLFSQLLVHLIALIPGTLWGRGRVRKSESERVRVRVRVKVRGTSGESKQTD